MNPVDEKEWLKAWELIAEYDAQRPSTIKEYRLYYNTDGTVIGLWENGFPDDEEYIVLDDPDVFHRHNTMLVRIVDKKIKLLDPTIPHRVKLVKSAHGYPVIKGMAAILLEPDQIEYDIEYYDHKNN